MHLLTAVGRLIDDGFAYLSPASSLDCSGEHYCRNASGAGMALNGRFQDAENVARSDPETLTQSAVKRNPVDCERIAGR